MNSGRFSKKKVASSKRLGAAAQTAKQKSKMNQAPPSAFDHSKKKSQSLTALSAGRRLRKQCTSQGHIKLTFLFFIFTYSSLLPILGTFIFWVGKCSGYR